MMTFGRLGGPVFVRLDDMTVKAVGADGALIDLMHGDADLPFIIDEINSDAQEVDSYDESVA